MRKTMVVSLLLVVAAYAGASSVVWTGMGPGTGGTLLASQAMFDVTGSSLTITLANVSPVAAKVPSDLLTGVYFDILGSPTLTPVSVVLAPGSTVLGGPDGGGDVSGEFAYRGDLSGNFNDAQYGVSNSGMDYVFGGTDLFSPNDLDTPLSPDGMNYGIAPSSGIDPNANLYENDGVTLKEPFVQYAVVISFDLGDYQLDVNDIYNVSFQYGTSLEQPNIPGWPVDPYDPFDPPVPEPATMSLLAIGLGGMLFKARKHF